jgi:hypothetical protein
MDKFNKYVLLACAVMCVIIISFYYIGFALGLSGLGGGADDAVNDAATAAGGGVGHSSWYELTQNGEYVGFCSIGIVGGLAAGYLYAAVFENPAYITDKTETSKIEARRAN